MTLLILSLLLVLTSSEDLVSRQVLLAQSVYVSDTYVEVCVLTLAPEVSCLEV